MTLKQEGLLLYLVAVVFLVTAFAPPSQSAQTKYTSMYALTQSVAISLDCKQAFFESSLRLQRIQDAKYQISGLLPMPNRLKEIELGLPDLGIIDGHLGFIKNPNKLAARLQGLQYDLTESKETQVVSLILEGKEAITHFIQLVSTPEGQLKVFETGLQKLKNFKQSASKTEDTLVQGFIESLIFWGVGDGLLNHLLELNVHPLLFASAPFIIVAAKSLARMTHWWQKGAPDQLSNPASESDDFLEELLPRLQRELDEGTADPKRIIMGTDLSESNDLVVSKLMSRQQFCEADTFLTCLFETYTIPGTHGLADIGADGVPSQLTDSDYLQPTERGQSFTYGSLGHWGRHLPIKNIHRDVIFHYAKDEANQLVPVLHMYLRSSIDGPDISDYPRKPKDKKREAPKATWIPVQDTGQ